jgi:hypothetical protein
MFVQKIFVASGFHVVLFFTSAVDEHNSVRHTHFVNPLNAKLNPICHLLVLLAARHILHVSGLRVNYVPRIV